MYRGTHMYLLNIQPVNENDGQPRLMHANVLEFVPIGDGSYGLIMTLRFACTRAI